MGKDAFGLLLFKRLLSGDAYVRDGHSSGVCGAGDDVRARRTRRVDVSDEILDVDWLEFRTNWWNGRCRERADALL